MTTSAGGFGLLGEGLLFYGNFKLVNIDAQFTVHVVSIQESVQASSTLSP